MGARQRERCWDGVVPGATYGASDLAVRVSWRAAPPDAFVVLVAIAEDDARDGVVERREWHDADD